MYFLANQIAYFKILLTRRCFEYTRLQISDLTREKKTSLFSLPKIMYRILISENLCFIKTTLTAISYVFTQI